MIYSSGLECSNVDEFCKDVKTKTNCTEIYKENCSQQKEETDMVILMQNCTKNSSEVNIFSPAANISSCALYFNATFLFSNYTNTKDMPLHLGISFKHQNLTMFKMNLKVKRKVHDSQNDMIKSFILKYKISDGNKGNKMVVQNIVSSVCPKRKSSFSLTISFKIHMNLFQKKLNVIGNLIDMNQTKVIDHSATVGLTKSFVTDHKTPGKENFYLVILKRNVSSTERIEIENIFQPTNYTG